MTDLHSHILFGVDDGSASIAESIELISRLKNIGFDNIVLTPHYIANSRYTVPNSEKEKRLEVLRNALKEQNIDINLYLGNETFISDYIVEDIKKGNVATINNSKYFLLEIPFHNQILGLTDIIYEIKLAGYIPILVHPERYTYFQRDYNLVDELKREGVLFQCNFSSILDDYGSNARKLLKYMLKNHYVDYLGTDIHHVSRSFVIDNFDKIEKAFIKIAGSEYYKEIIDNTDKLVK